MAERRTDRGLIRGPRRRLAVCTGLAGLAATPAAAATAPIGATAATLANLAILDTVAGSGLAGTPAAPQVPAPPSIVARGLVEITAPVILNARLIGEISVNVDTAGGGDVDAARLLALLAPQLDPALAAALRKHYAGRARLPLADLSVSPLTIVFDPGALELRATVPSNQLQAQTMSLRGVEVPDPARFQPQAGIAGGVALGVSQRWIESGADRGRAPLTLGADGFVTVGAFPGVTLRGGGLFTERDGRGGFDFERAQTRLTYDDFGRAIHYAAGEFNPPLTGFQGGARMLGIAVARDYAGIRPFENIRPSGRGSVTLDRPSTIIVEVNGIETKRLRLDPGRYQLSDLSAAAGANDVRLFVQDDLGRREVAAATFFTATAMLDKGLTDFGFALGRRESRTTHYGGPLTATGYLRRGITGNLTLGAGAQYAAGDWQADTEAVVGTPIGLFRLQWSLSDVAGRHGRAASLDYLHTIDLGGSTLDFTVLSSIYSRNFASPFDRNGRVNDQKWRVDARADWRRGDLAVSLGAAFARTRSNTQEQSVQLTGYLTRAPLSYTLSAGIEKLGPKPWRPRLLFGVSLPIGPHGTASARVDSRNGTAVAEYSRYPVDQVGDLSGRLTVGRDNDRYGVTGDLRYFGNRFIATAEQSLFKRASDQGLGTRETILRASTFIGFADGKFAVGRPTQGNFAIYDRHPSLGNAKVTVRDEAGLVVGRQDWLGSALVPFNRVFSPVYQVYDVDPLPDGYDLGEGRLAALPGAFSGYRVAVGSDASRVAIGVLLENGQPVATMSGVVERLGDKGFAPRPFFTNANGRFAVDKLKPGQYRMVIGDREVARFVVKPDQQGMIDVGRIQASHR